MKQPKGDINFKNLLEIAGGDEEFIREMLILFCKNSVSLMKELDSSFQQGDYEQVSSLAHKLKSSIQIVADKDLHALIKKIELESKSTTEQKEMKKMIDLLGHSMTGLIKAIEKRLENPNKFN